MPCFVERTGFTGGGAVGAARRAAPPTPARSIGPVPRRQTGAPPAATANARIPATQTSSRQPAAPQPRPPAHETAASPAPRAATQDRTLTPVAPSQVQPRSAPQPNATRTSATRPGDAVPKAAEAPQLGGSQTRAARATVPDRNRERLSSLASAQSTVRSYASSRQPGLDRMSEALERAQRSAAVAGLIADREAAYLERAPGKRELVHVTLANGITYSYDSTNSTPTNAPANRLVAAWGVSGRPAGPRDAARLAGFPPPDGKGSNPLDRGHVVAHAAGGTEDGINLVPQDRELNRGTGSSDDKKRWRDIERQLARRPGTPFVVRPEYVDDTDFPGTIEIGIQDDDGTWEFHTFDNR
jgi:hypothetical protein